MYATPGQYFVANVNYQNGQYNWYMENDYTGVIGTFSQADANFSGATTDFIAEDPRNITPDLYNFKTLQFAYVASASQQSPVNAYPNDNVLMTENGLLTGTPMATAGPLSPSGYSFNDGQEHCS